MSNHSSTSPGFDAAGSVFELVQQAMTAYADRPAFSCLGQTLTFKEIEQQSRALSGYLQHNTNLVPGDRIAIQLPNIIQFPVAAYAALSAGLVIVNTNPLYTTREMAHQFRDAGVKGIIAFSEVVPKLAQVMQSDDAGCVIETVIVTRADDLLTGEQAISELLAPELAESFSPGVSLTSFNAAIGAGQAQDARLVKPKGMEALALLQYTGGTTGLSKGAMLSHGNLVANVRQTHEKFAGVQQPGEDIYICPLPLYHIYAFMVNLLLAAAQGAHNVLIPNPRDLDAFVGAIKPYAFTCFTGINTLFVGLCHHQGFKQLDFSRLKLTISGGSALTLNAANLWHRLTGCTISEGYGLSETSPVLCFNTPGNEKLGTIGWPLIDTEIEIWDEDNRALSRGETGEIVARGPQVMSGYWQQPQASEQALVNGFFKTGDIGLIHQDGRVQIIDRKKDMILVSGFNVYPNEVEGVLALHPKVLESAVVGHADESSGEKVCAYIVLEEGVPGDSDNAEYLIAEEVTAYCRSQLSAYKVPKEYHFVGELPKSTVGKILRRELRR
ncbi:AMP-binding protein [Thalassomonas viridans]|uniref:Long-chain-fatty-acid--CoA ligase n=1 Tax=Thalassomonas viridans TaxID=137584 RepID=A0AAE9YZW7_9GAMM|nr:AMP-binding protein [Thalassomonas viridans]WDE04060.1 AMP-binding protein [Thalassomonas viridans]